MILLINDSVLCHLPTPHDCSTTHRGDARAPFISSWPQRKRWYMEVCHTLGVRLEYESILRKLPKVSEVATNQWVFLRCDRSPNSIWFYYWSLVKKKDIFPNLMWMGNKSWLLSSKVWLRVKKVLGTPKRLSKDHPLFW